MNVDLHCHSTASDGLLAPRDVVARAAANGVTTLALTDHDAVTGLDEARVAATESGLQFIDGVEISVTWRWQVVHIVGLQIDPRNDVLVEGLMHVRSSRRRRAEQIAKQFDDLGIRGTLEGAYQHAEDPELIGRSHFARHLVGAGHARDVKSVFDRYLTPGKPGYVPQQWAELGDAVRWIRAAGGVAVVAHPGRYKISRDVLITMLDEFKTHGGAGIEVVTGSHSPEQYREFAALARSVGLAASRGSDFHGPGESAIELGTLPALEGGLTPVWTLLQ